MSEREHKRGHEGSRARRTDEALKKRKSPLQSGNQQAEGPAQGPETRKDFRI
jgi:hypothetical protein